MVMSVGPAAHAIHSVGHRAYDPKGLGRWSATRFAGKYGKALRVISAYRPNQNKGGELLVYAQHLAKLAELNDDRDPLKAFDEDLYDALSEWRDEGDSIILRIDFNDDVRARSTTERFESLQMREVLLERHGVKGPETYADGSCPVDGIFASDNINIAGGGYLEFGAFADTDHCALWVDIP